MSNKEELIYIFSELEKCKSDPIYFIENYIKVDIGGIKQPMKLREKQKIIIETALKDHYLIILGSRQTGKTTVMVAFSVWLAMFFENYPIYMVHRDEKGARDLIRDFRMFYDGLPDWMKYKIEKRSPLQLEFKNKSRVIAMTVPIGKESDVGRGMRGGFIIIDEAAFQRDLKALMKGLMPATTFIHRKYEEEGIPYGIALISTPNGKYDKNGNLNEFYRLWTLAQNGKSIYKPIKYHWSEVPEYKNDPEFKKKALEIVGKDIRAYNQEYELVFLGNENTFFDDETIKNLEKFAREPVDEIELPSGGKLHIYEENLFENISNTDIFICGVDIGSQYGSDPSTMVILRLNDMKVVADYVRKLKIKDFGIDIVFTGVKIFSNRILFAIERSPISEELLERLSESSISSLIIKDSKGKYGIPMNKATRPLVFDALRRHASNYPDKVISDRLVRQLMTLERNPRTGKIETPRGLGHHGDLAIAYGLTCYTKEYVDITDYIYYLDKENIENNLEFIKGLISKYKGPQVYVNNINNDELLEYLIPGVGNGFNTNKSNNSSENILDIIFK